ncbi:MAG: glycosyltransferase [Phenylobacterium sp.]|uniref:glycosyltransferase family 2 protein n=1 Tax=Phenylobacterium sp. TaxID=1871053 RepID=UPI0025F97066|nr:glycosyltransferase family 2 protein [Phenylobacterium sp.]MBI1198233.1 glycosyltransferase [Phenylobacterium sp.]
MPSLIRTVSHEALQAIRRVPVIHGPVHALAKLIEKTPIGARYIRSVLEPESLSTGDYGEWIRRWDTLTLDDRKAIAAHVGRMTYRPLISVVMPVYGVSPALLSQAIESVRRQLYPHWELCIADDASPGDAVWKRLEREARDDPRIKIVRRTVNGHICAATNSALQLATGEFVALMDHDDILPARALYEVAALLQDHPDADLIYSDEDKIDASGRRYEPYFKTDWNPELILAQNMISHLGVYRRSLIEAVGGLREGFEGSQDYDLALRVSELTTRERIHHIPWVLYHWRQEGGPQTFSQGFMDRCAEAARRAVAEHLERTGQPGVSVDRLADTPGWVDVRRAPPEPRPLVSIIVPTRDRAELLAQCADGVLNHTAYSPLELLIVDNGSVEPETKALFETLSADPRVRVIAAPGPFNYSALNNLAAAQAKGEILLLLNNDISMIEPGWLDELVAHAVRPSVGAVGARLLFPDGRLQHGGVAVGLGGVAGHVGYLHPGDNHGYYKHLGTTRNVSAVTAACMALRKSVFEEVGGLDAERLKVAFNDVDLCLKIRRAGYDIVWTPRAELYHHESASRGDDRDPADRARFDAEVEVMRERWGEALETDPFYGPLFDRRHSDFRLASPPARKPPWISSDSRR